MTENFKNKARTEFELTGGFVVLIIVCTSILWWAS
jgi:hypothetical protein